MSRRYYGSIKAEGISPGPNNPKKIETVDELNSVGLVLSKENAEDLITYLQNAIQDSEINKINLTGFRETNQVTISAYVPV